MKKGHLLLVGLKIKNKSCKAITECFNKVPLQIGKEEKFLLKREKFSNKSDVKNRGLLDECRHYQHKSLLFPDIFIVKRTKAKKIKKFPGSSCDTLQAPKEYVNYLKEIIISFFYFSWLVDWILWQINLCRLFNAKSIFMQIISSISNNSV